MLEAQDTSRANVGRLDGDRRSRREAVRRERVLARDLEEARRVLDPERRVGEREALAQDALELAADRVAVGAGLDEYVRRQRGEPGRDRPDVEVVHVDDALGAAERLADGVDVEPGRRPLEQDRDRLAEDAARA